MPYTVQHPARRRQRRRVDGGPAVARLGPAVSRARRAARHPAASFTTRLYPRETAVDFAVVVNRNHMRGVQPCGRIGFAAESLLKVLSEKCAGSSLIATVRSLVACHARATPRPCRRGPTTRSGDNARTACPPPAHHTQPAAPPTGKPATALTTSGRSSTAELRLLARAWRVARHLGCTPSTALIDQLLDERAAAVASWSATTGPGQRASQSPPADAVRGQDQPGTAARR